MAQIAASEPVVANVREAVRGGEVVVCVSGAPGLGRRTLLFSGPPGTGVPR